MSDCLCRFLTVLIGLGDADQAVLAAAVAGIAGLRCRRGLVVLVEAEHFALAVVGMFNLAIVRKGFPYEAASVVSTVRTTATPPWDWLWLR